MWSPASGFSNTSLQLVVLLSVTKLVGFFGDLHNDLELISLRLSVLWLNLLQSALFCLWLSPVPGLFINWMSTMLSCKEICLKLFTVPSLQALRTPLTQIMCAGSIDLSTVLSRLPVPGTADLPLIFYSWDLLKPRQMPPYLSIITARIWRTFFSMWMISF
jgi:hypothetical protein